LIAAGHYSIRSKLDVLKAIKDYCHYVKHPTLLIMEKIKNLIALRLWEGLYILQVLNNKQNNYWILLIMVQPF
jgi:hypothetical protein